MPKKVILCSSAENKIQVKPVVLPLTSQKPPENFDFNVSCSLTDDTTKTPTKPQQKLIESSKENSMKEVSMVASTSHNISLANASSTSQTIEFSNNLSWILSTPIKTNIYKKSYKWCKWWIIHITSNELYGNRFLKKRKDWSIVSYSMFREKGN